jgi:hypothetical protein
MLGATKAISCPRAVLATMLICSFLPNAVRADQAVLNNGKRLEGTLELTRDNRLVFLPAGLHPSLSLESLHDVRWPRASVPPWLRGSLHHFELVDGQRLTGQLVALDNKDLRVRVPWAESMSIPRSHVRAIIQPRGFLTSLAGDFETNLRSWKVSGGATLDSSQHLSGRQSLLLDRPGQAAEFQVPQPLVFGRAGISFFDGGQQRGARWLAEFVFHPETRAPALRCVIAGHRSYTVEGPSPAVTPVHLARSNGWHRLVVEHAPACTTVTVDDRVLWSAPLAADARLSQVRLACVLAGDNVPARGTVWFDDFSLACGAEDLHHQAADPQQDEIWLSAGEQLLGSLAGTDRRTIELDARFGKRKLAWGEVRGIFLRVSNGPALKGADGQVRVCLQAAEGAEADQLVGHVRALRADRIMLRHALLGDLEIERTWLRRMAAVQ